MTAAAALKDDARALSLTRLIATEPAKVYRCFVEPELLKQWFAPLPYTTPHAALDVRPGGTSHIVMRGPDGTDMPLWGVYLEVVENARLVMTDAYSSAWVPSEKPFMTMVVTFEAEAGKTRYTAGALHWTTEDKEAHEKMGFHEGWGQCADQLARLAESL